jgi:hypothetical protein
LAGRTGSATRDNGFTTLPPARAVLRTARGGWGRGSTKRKVPGANPMPSQPLLANAQHGTASPGNGCTRPRRRCRVTAVRHYNEKRGFLTGNKGLGRSDGRLTARIPIATVQTVDTLPSGLDKGHRCSFVGEWSKRDVPWSH